MNAARLVVSLAAGLVFGFGLALSGMLDPSRVRGFLDVTGQWDPSLAFVLGGAVLVAAVGMLIVRAMRRPVLDDRFHLPPTRPVDRRLVVGSAIFGIGWGMAGLCPGPAIAGIAVGLPASMIFLAAMILGMAAHDLTKPNVAAPVAV